ncbi:putative hydrolase [Lyophyllum shimeji]|uniref:Hydrolase n=1 Tax=Lyophyllum shimeji TaxID=47721 RepID=A0A9P3PJ19_LYOSH|nr:putative hydrolase [Lyophyllum shimeji]
MQAVVSRPQVLGGSGGGSSSRVPRRSSSYLSLRREKDKSPPPLDSSTAVASAGPSYSSRPSYFDVYPRPKTTPNVRPSKSKGHRSSPSTKTSFGVEQTSISRQGRAEPAYPFPAFDPSEDAVSPTTPTQNPRARSRTGPSGRAHWEEAIPRLRFSGSSSTQHTETPPRTPVDFNPSRESFENFPVVVAAPVAGVETMDALVDGMNGGDDILSHSASISNRARFGIPGHHPLYQPPLPTPPPGVVLGGGKARRPKRTVVPRHSSDSDDEDERAAVSASRPRRRRTRPSPSRSASNSTLSPLPTPTPPAQELAKPSSSTPNATPRKPSVETGKVIVPSISDIIRTHAPPEGQVRSRPSTARSSSYYAHSQGHATVHEEPESEPEPLTLEEEAELLSRSSIDSVADEVQRTLRSQLLAKPRAPAAPPSSFLKRHSEISDNLSIYSPRSDPGAPSTYCASIASNHYPPSTVDGASMLSSTKPASASQEVAKYLRSTRLTTLLRLTRSPHASHDNPLTVSLSDLGSSTGYPVVVFLGLGCVRHIMGLYDEMAEILNLRLITIDRWGLGRTEPRSKSSKGIMQWASVVEEVLDLLHIGQCSIMAHSAGAPYALSFANKVPGRIRGDICLLAPWVGGSESSGYKWLKYVPNGILKTAQAAEWKIQAWMIGKPPTIAYEGIGYDAHATAKPSPERRASSPQTNGSLDAHYASLQETRSRPSIGSSIFSEYDDLRDFDGRFESRSTLGAGSTRPSLQGPLVGETKLANKRKTSRGFLNRLKGSSNSPQSPTEEKSLPGGKTLKALRSMGSLKGKSATAKESKLPTPQLPPSLQIDVGLGLTDLDWPRTQSELSLDRDPFAATPPRLSTASGGPYGRSSGRRSISFTSPKATLSMPSSPSMSMSTANSSLVAGIVPGSSYQAVLGNALIAASHAESAKGTHNDLLQILNHENHPWGFSYTSYPHHVQVWYGDKDEKIAENAVRWMAKAMGEDRCSVKVVKGADHGLMYRSGVVVEVLEQVLTFWK